jgi:hypothetical protein
MSIRVVLLALVFTGAGIAAASAQSSPEERRPVYASEPVRAKTDAMPARPARCLDLTATRIRRANEGCRYPGRSYDQEDLRRTGATDVGEALRLLDPAISGGRRR